MNSTLVILAGGFGTRLQSVLNGVPKALADVNGEPFLKYQFENWIKNGFNDFIISLHYKADLIINFIEINRGGLLKNCKVQYIIEPSPFGTGGAIAYLISNLDVTNPFFVTNADTWIDCEYDKLDLSKECVIGLTTVNNVSRYGNVILDNENYIIDFEEKAGIEKNGLISIGLYKLEKSIFSMVKKNNFSIENDLFPLLIKEKMLKGKNLNAKFIDIGIPIDYYKFCKWKKTL